MGTFSSRRKVVFSCPCCRAPLIKRTSYLSHPYLRHDTFVCDNPLCGAAFSGHTELTHIASPSGMPEASLCELPPTPSLLRNAALAAYRADQHERQLDLLDGADVLFEPAH